MQHRNSSPFFYIDLIAFVAHPAGPAFSEAPGAGTTPK
jgi:hypothetical protein